MKKNEIWFKKSRFVKPLIALYFFVAFIEVIAEYNEDVFFIRYAKPLTIPILFLLYWISSRNKNQSYILSLVLVWVASILFVSKQASLVLAGSLSYLLSLFIVIYLVVSRVKNPGRSLLFVGSLPFLCFYLVVGFLTYDRIGLGVFLLIIQSVFMIFLSSLCFTNYLTKVSKSNTYLLVCSILFALSSIIFLTNGLAFKNAKLYALNTVFFVVGQFIFYLYLIGEDKKLKRYNIIN